MNIIKANFTAIHGKIKPMHAINNPPTVPDDRYGLYSAYKKAGIPFARLHDTGGDFGGGHYVDVENVFRDPDAATDAPESYDFAFTDSIVKLLVSHDTQPFYRLGCTIENNCTLRAYHIYPPRDPLRWAKICEGIIRHYNEGWADGYHFNIKYWEIWNEPDNEPDPMKNPMWRGSAAEYYNLYRTASVYLRERFPDISIGGYASCGFYALDNTLSGEAHSSPRLDYFIEFFHGFLDYITTPGYKCPLDFFSWHSYAGIENNKRYAEYCRAELDRYGFQGTEIIFNEWNPGTAARGKLIDAGRIASMMCALQYSPVDMAMYYDGQVSSSYCGLFDPVSHGVFKAYHVFEAWNELYKLGNAVEVEAEDLYAAAATDGTTRLMLVANPHEEKKTFTTDQVGVSRLKLLDMSHDLTDVIADRVIELDPGAVALIYIDITE